MSRSNKGLPRFRQIGVRTAVAKGFPQGGIGIAFSSAIPYIILAMYFGSLAERPVGVLQGGGLSSTALGVWLAEQGVEAYHLVADIGQAPAAELEATVAAWRARGVPAALVDLRAPMAALALDLVRYQARHDGGYWNTTGAARLVLVEHLAPRLVAEGRTVLAHGCVGGGNDQRRFARYTDRFAPGLAVYAPWTDPDALRRFPGRAAM